MILNQSFVLQIKILFMMESFEDRGKIVYENVKIDEVSEAEVGKDSSWTFLFRQVVTN